jgi:hypothetical protein
MNRHLMKNPHWTPAQEEQIAKAERLSAKATIYELGAGEFLKGHTPCGDEIEVIREVLGDSVILRRQSRIIHNNLRPNPPRKKKAKG